MFNKKTFFTLLFFFAFGFANAQDISQSEVPSIVLNNFLPEFPKATDIEWKMDGNLYRADFEMRWNKDYDVWYDGTGEKVKQRIEIEKRELPPSIVSKVSTDFKGYRIEGAERMTKGKKVYYELEMDANLKGDWKIMIDEKGKILSLESD